MKQAVLVVSFGTTYSETREKNIGAVLRRISAAAPGLPVYEAWTSSMILRALRKRGESVDDVPAAMARMEADGITDVRVLPTHLLYGDEFDKMQRCGGPLFLRRHRRPPALLRRRPPHRAAGCGRRRGNCAR